MAIGKALSNPYSYNGKNGIGTGKVPIGHLRSKTLEIGKESDARPELPKDQQHDGRKGS